MCSQRGFTLLEVLIVMLLVALTATIVTLNFRHDLDQVVENEARRFAALMNQLCQESIIQSKVFATTEDGATGYRFVVLTNDGWKPLTGDDLFRPRSLPEDINIELALNNSIPRTDKKVYLQCGPDGVLPVFSALFSTDGIRYLVETNERQELQISLETTE